MLVTKEVCFNPTKAMELFARLLPKLVKSIESNRVGKIKSFEIMDHLVSVPTRMRWKNSTRLLVVPTLLGSNVAYSKHNE